MNIKLHRTAALAVLGCVLAAAPLKAEPGNKVEREEKFTASGSGKTELTVKNPRGRTVVVGRSDATTVSILATRVYAAAGWFGVSALGASISALALVFWALTRGSVAPSPSP